MASRRDELNAYNFARRRTVGAFLQPGGGGNDEDAPRPVRAVLPSFVVAAVAVAGFGMWGVIKPSAPLNWDDGKNIIQGKDSTTRYVVLEDPQTHEKVLHQVLNMSSARLLLPAGAKVVPVADKVLDNYKNHGATVGIPYAPDKLPSAQDAGEAKLWSVCDRPGVDTSQASINQAVFIAAGDEAKTLSDPAKVLQEGQGLYVQAPPVKKGDTPSRFLVDQFGVKHAVGKLDMPADRRRALQSGLFGDSVEPEQVTKAWLDTLATGEVIDFPKISDLTTTKTKSKVNLTKTEDAFVGRLLVFQNTYYVVGKEKLFQVTPFQAELIRNDPDLTAAYGGDSPKAAELSPGDNAKLASQVEQSMLDKTDLPDAKPQLPLNVGPKGNRSTVCSTFAGYDDKGQPKRTVWAHTEYPAKVALGSASAHVTPGHGLLYRAVDGEAGPASQDTSGTTFLITETGLRYSLQANSDGGNGPSPAPSAGQQQEQAKDEENGSQARLGYKSVAPSRVPQPWSILVPAGGSLSTKAAETAQTA
ncbi:type VII secretion protein EccB [Kitasatospora sp. NPDC085879]|uniref:type VII secretion protein EccB n=1 Tax=Kitasatospora sp. NPDC085879 TaxID=3154769 RepID=UPI000BB0D892|nr:type VII secretion protein EccB [Streptomyces sp. TLI_235]PBC79774.1 type VII secretion protein EccB [Streptomyces sp. TLI_235]